MDAIEQSKRILGLVGLQLADEVKRQIRMSFQQFWPLALRFLHPVFTEHTVPGLYQRDDAFGRLGLGNGNQLNFGGIAFGKRCGIGNAGANIVKGTM